jgi:hypothetical protein
MKSIIILGKMADSIVFFWLMVLGLKNLYLGSTADACMLICTAVAWQRLGKVEMLRYLEERAKNGK